MLDPQTMENLHVSFCHVVQCILIVEQYKSCNINLIFFIVVVQILSPDGSVLISDFVFYE